MKVFLKISSKTAFYLETQPRQPMERERFYVLAALAAWVVLAVVLLLWRVWR